MKKTCRDCVWDAFDAGDPEYKECCALGDIPEEMFETYDDDELPEHCGWFSAKEA